MDAYCVFFSSVLSVLPQGTEALLKSLYKVGVGDYGLSLAGESM